MNKEPLVFLEHILESIKNIESFSKKLLKERFLKDKKINPNLLLSGFLDGELIYILEIPFLAISKRLKEQLPKKRKIGEYKRMANFNYSHFKNNRSINFIYFNKNTFLKSEKYFNKNFFKFLKIKVDTCSTLIS